MKEVQKLYKSFGSSEIVLNILKTEYVNKDLSWKSHAGMETSRCDTESALLTSLNLNRSIQIVIINGYVLTLFH